jgi:hypothetical protein
MADLSNKIRITVGSVQLDAELKFMPHYRLKVRSTPGAKSFILNWPG